MYNPTYNPQRMRGQHTGEDTLPDNEEQTQPEKRYLSDNPLDGLADRINDAQQATDKMWSKSVTEAQPFPDGGSIAHVSEATDDWGKPYTADVREAKDALKATPPDWDTGKGNPDLSALSIEDLQRLAASQVGEVVDGYTADLSDVQPITNAEGEAVDVKSLSTDELIAILSGGEEGASDE